MQHVNNNLLLLFFLCWISPLDCEIPYTIASACDDSFWAWQKLRSNYNGSQYGILLQQTCILLLFIIIISNYYFFIYIICAYYIIKKCYIKMLLFDDEF